MILYRCRWSYCHHTGAIALWNNRPKRIFNSNLAKSLCLVTQCSIVKSFWNLAQTYSVKIAKTIVLCNRDFAKFEFKMRFGRISYVATAPWVFALRPYSSPPWQNGRDIADDVFKCIFTNVKFLIRISLKFAPKGPIDNNSILVQLMAWRLAGDKPLSEPMLTQFIDTRIYAVPGESYAMFRWRQWQWPRCCF